MIDGVFNFRDTAGTALASGRATRAGVLYRSAALGGMSAGGQRAFAESPIGVVVDFRNADERQMVPDVLPSSRAFYTVELPVLEGAANSSIDAELAAARLAAAGPGDEDADGASTGSLEAVPAIDHFSIVYTAMLTHAAESFARVARLVGASRDDEPSAVLVHCTAGKDRTGVAVALMLDAVGATREAVVADYTASERYLAGAWAERMLAAIQSTGTPLTPRLRELVTATPAAAIERALAWVEDRHGSSSDYLRSGGLTDAELGALRARLIG